MFPQLISFGDAIFCAVLTLALHVYFHKIINFTKLMITFIFKIFSSFILSLILLALWKLRNVNKQLVLQFAQETYQSVKDQYSKQFHKGFSSSYSDEL